MRFYSASKKERAEVGKQIFFICSGLGMGNASRIYAILEAIRERQPAISPGLHVFTWGKAHDFLLTCPGHGTLFQLHRLRSYNWPLRQENRWRRGAKLFAMPIAYSLTYFINTITLWRAARKLDCSVAVLDSDYHFLPFLRRHVYLCFLGQAVDVLRRAKEINYRPKGWPAHFTYFVGEWFDARLQLFFSDMIFAPSLGLERCEMATDRKVRFVPLIVRREFRFRGAQIPPVDRAVLLPSGSGLFRKELERLANDCGIPMLGAPEALPPMITHPGDLDQAEVIVVQGGLSSISECIARQRFMVVIPLAGRAEQEINALTVEHLRLGISCSTPKSSTVRDAVRKGKLWPILVNDGMVSGADVVAECLVYG
jgi:hypothetical protein